MKLTALLKKFRNDESGAVTVDWVVLTAAIIGLGFIVMNVVSGALQTKATEMSTAIGNVSVGTWDQVGAGSGGGNGTPPTGP